jgi:hypothetical protein
MINLTTPDFRASEGRCGRSRRPTAERGVIRKALLRERRCAFPSFPQSRFRVADLDLRDELKELKRDYVRPPVGLLQ